MIWRRASVPPPSSPPRSRGIGSRIVQGLRPKFVVGALHGHPQRGGLPARERQQRPLQLLASHRADELGPIVVRCAQRSPRQVRDACQASSARFIRAELTSRRASRSSARLVASGTPGMTVVAGCAAAARRREGRLRGIGPSYRNHHPIITHGELDATAHRVPGQGSSTWLCRGQRAERQHAGPQQIGGLRVVLNRE